MAAKGASLTTGQALDTGDYLVSAHHFAVMQGDGNFCIYRGSGPEDNLGFRWGSVQKANYAPADGAYSLVMQGDGNLCCYRNTATGPVFVWGSVQLGQYLPVNGNYTAVLQDDGNFCIYPEGSATAKWCTMSNKSPSVMKHFRVRHKLL